MPRLSSIVLPNNVEYDLKDKDAINLGLTGLSVGDIVQVGAVDANGKPTAWTLGGYDNISFYIDVNGHLIETLGVGALPIYNFYLSNGHLYLE